MESSTQVLYNERKALVNFQFIWGRLKKRLASSVLYYQAWEKDFWSVLEALEETPSASPSPNLVS